MFARKNLSALLIGISLLVLILVACSPQPAGIETDEPEATGPPETEVTSGGSEIGGYTELVEALRADGMTVEPGEEIEQTFFEVPAQVIRVNGTDVQVFQFPDEAARQAAQDTISPDGSSIGTTMVTWVDQPHFYAKGRLIVLYVGSDAAVLDMLQSVLGDPIAG